MAEDLAQERAKITGKVLLYEHLQVTTDMVNEYKRNDSYKTDEVREILKHLKDAFKIPYKQVESIFSQRVAIIGDLQLIRYIAFQIMIIVCYL